MKLISLAIVASLLASLSTSAAAITISVKFDPSVRADAATGRLQVYLIRVGSKANPLTPPADGFVEEDPQPIYGIDVADVQPGTAMIVDDAAANFGGKLSELQPGKYNMQAVLDVNRANSNWQREPGNLSSAPKLVEIKPGDSSVVELELTKTVAAQKSPATKGVEIFELRSKLLSDFKKRDVIMRAGVVFPTNHDPNRAYPAVYEVPGFGGDHSMAVFKAQQRTRRPPGSDAERIAASTFWIMLDPESENGHTLFADSDNNGPCGKALTEELIPALEAKYKLIAQASARLVRGHSSGGWSSLWLATEYPNIFGACWSSSPDPVDFRRFELVDVYAAESMFVGADGKEIPAARFSDDVTMTIRQENGMEYALGPGNNTAQQWDSWQGVYGRRAPTGGIALLFDEVTGKIDRAEAESYRRFDITDRLRKDPKKFGPIFRNNIRLVCGTEDTYYLNEAVQLLKEDLDRVFPADVNSPGNGYIKLIPGDHGSIFGSTEMKAIAGEMMDHLTRAGHVSKP